MRKYFRYFWYIVRHKWYVFLECVKVGLFFRAWTHDLSKFLPDEFFAYAEYFYGGYERGKQPPEVKAAFNYAWLKHIHRNPHHWQHFLLREDNPKPKYHQEMLDTVAGDVFICTEGSQRVAIVPLEHGENCMTRRDETADFLENTLNTLPTALDMPAENVVEMVADWRGAGRAISGIDDSVNWFLKNQKKMTLSEKTLERVKILLRILGV